MSVTTCPSGVAEVYFQVRPLLAGARPAIVVRDRGATLIVCDPGTSRARLAEWAQLHLTNRERNAYRAAFGQPPIGQPLDDEWVSDRPVATELPPELRLEHRRIA